MKEINIRISGCELSQKQARGMALIIAEQGNPEAMAVSRFNRRANACSPCCLKDDLGGKPGWEVYGENHGGRLKITVNDGEFVFVFS